jgi:hypothetical protein
VSRNRVLRKLRAARTRRRSAALAASLVRQLERCFGSAPESDWVSRPRSQSRIVARAHAARSEHRALVLREWREFEDLVLDK